MVINYFAKRQAKNNTTLNNDNNNQTTTNTIETETSITMTTNEINSVNENKIN